MTPRYIRHTYVSSVNGARRLRQQLLYVRVSLRLLQREVGKHEEAIGLLVPRSPRHKHDPVHLLRVACREQPPPGGCQGNVGCLHAGVVVRSSGDAAEGHSSESVSQAEGEAGLVARPEEDASVNSHWNIILPRPPETPPTWGPTHLRL